MLSRDKTSYFWVFNFLFKPFSEKIIQLENALPTPDLIPFFWLLTNFIIWPIELNDFWQVYLWRIDVFKVFDELTFGELMKHQFYKQNPHIWWLTLKTYLDKKHLKLFKGITFPLCNIWILEDQLNVPSLFSVLVGKDGAAWFFPNLALILWL